MCRAAHASNFARNSTIQSLMLLRRGSKAATCRRLPRDGCSLPTDNVIDFNDIRSIRDSPDVNSSGAKPCELFRTAPKRSGSHNWTTGDTARGVVCPNVLDHSITTTAAAIIAAARRWGAGTRPTSASTDVARGSTTAVADSLVAAVRRGDGRVSGERPAMHPQN